MCMSLCVHNSCSLEAYINQVNDILGFLHVTRCSLLHNKKLSQRDIWILEMNKWAITNKD